MISAFNWIPKSVAAWVIENNRSPGMAELRENGTYACEVAAELIEEKRDELRDGTFRKDVLSVLGSSCCSPIRVGPGATFGSLVQANSTLRQDWRLSDEEIVAQIR